MKKLSVVTPVYYNEESLPELHKQFARVEKQLAELGIELEVIFVDDGSKDNSFRELMRIKEARRNTRVIKLSRNFGAVRASNTGFGFVSGDCFMILSADLQDPPELIVEMAKRWLAGSKYVICERSSREDPITSKLAAYIYYMILRWLVLPSYPQGGYDMALMDREMLPYLQKAGKNVNTPLFAYWLGYEPTVLKYKREPRRHGKSRWTFSKKVKFFLDSILGFSIVPIRMISMVGVLCAAVGLGYGVSVIITTLVNGSAVPGFAAIAAMVSFFFGLIIIMLGIIGEYIWRIFDETSPRPEAVIDEIY